MAATLVTIPISHYGERARWALDLAGVRYHEVHHLQMFSWGSALRRGGKKTLPVVEIDSQVLTDSEDVLRYAAHTLGVALFPEGDAEAAAMSTRFAGDYGVATRLVGYDWFFRSLDLCLPFNAGRAPEHEVRALAAFRSVARVVAKRYLGVAPAAVAEAIDLVDRTMDDVAVCLEDGRPFLGGEQFTAADLTFAAMTAPSVLPPQYPVPLPALEDVPEDARARIRRWQAHPAGAFALRLYEQRPASRASFDRGLRRPPRR